MAVGSITWGTPVANQGTIGTSQVGWKATSSYDLNAVPYNVTSVTITFTFYLKANYTVNSGTIYYFIEPLINTGNALFKSYSTIGAGSQYTVHTLNKTYSVTPNSYTPIDFTFTAFGFYEYGNSTDVSGTVEIYVDPLPPAVAPTAPTINSVTSAFDASNNNVVTINYTKGYDGGATQTVYYKISQTDGGTALIGPSITSSSPVSVNVNSLAVNSTFWVYMYSTNSAGQSTTTKFSATSATGKPGAPTGLTAGSVVVTGTVPPKTSSTSLSWTAPTYTGGSTITGYQVSVSPIGPTITNTGTTTTASISNMTAGVTYSFTVAAVNTNGAGAASSAVTVTTPYLPNAPTISSVVSSVVSGVPTLTVTYQPDSTVLSSGGSLVTQYRLVSATNTTAWTFSPSSPLTINSGVTPGVSQTIEMRSYNDVGTNVTNSSYTLTPIGGRIMVKNSSGWSPVYIKIGSDLGASYTTNALVRIYDQASNTWKYTSN